MKEEGKPMETEKVYAGIDVAKDRLDVAVHSSNSK